MTDNPFRLLHSDVVAASAVGEKILVVVNQIRVAVVLGVFQGLDELISLIGNWVHRRNRIAWTNNDYRLQARVLSRRSFFSQALSGGDFGDRSRNSLTGTPAATSTCLRDIMARI